MGRSGKPGLREWQEEVEIYLREDAARSSDQLKVDLHTQQQGLPIMVERQTVGEFLSKWLEDLARPSVRPSTYSSYAQLVRLYIGPALGHIQLGKLSPQDIQHLLNKLLKSGLSPRTVQYCHAILRVALHAEC